MNLTFGIKQIRNLVTKLKPRLWIPRSWLRSQLPARSQRPAPLRGAWFLNPNRLLSLSDWLWRSHPVASRQLCDTSSVTWWPVAPVGPQGAGVARRGSLCPFLSGVPVLTGACIPLVLQLALSAPGGHQRPGEGWGRRAVSQPKVLPPPASARSSQPPGQASLCKHLQPFGRSWGSGPRLLRRRLPFPAAQAAPRGRGGKKLGSQARGKPQDRCGQPACSGRRAVLTPKSACPSRRGPGADQVPLTGMRVHHQPACGLGPTAERGGCSGLWGHAHFHP